ncbi:hypothetical protein [Glutamicibacter sp. JC586]|uniref:hypothetical protein n=1 Tax=Glutamicibacter sp. JC586 TaxID=2590552 RepID=UPI001357FD5F|nr:hypothetical protein [Glutamicibacter sp. JC586]
MLKKIVTTAAVVALASSALTGCSSGKLSTEESCTFMNDKAKELGLKDKMEGATNQLATGNTDSYSSVMDEVTNIMKDAAEKTEDDKLADALNAAVEDANKAQAILTDEKLSLQEKSVKIQESQSQDSEDKMAYLDQACPNMDGFE